MNERMLWLMFSIVVAACGDDPPSSPGPDANERTCSQTGPATGSPDVCDWEFTCSDFSGPTPQYAVHCEGAAGASYTCTCTIGAVMTGTITVPDACDSNAEMCAMANAGCGWDPNITCL
jgi:hypothetical protein